MRLWVASLCFYAFIFTLCEVLRYFTGKLLEDKLRNWNHQKLLTSLIYEFIGVLQICAPMFDVNFVMDHYGMSGVFLEISFIEFLNSFLLRDALADPCSLIYNYMKGYHSMEMASILLIIQFIAGYISYFVAKQFYSIGLHPQHTIALQEECTSDLTVAILYGSIVEAVGLLVGKMAEHYIDDDMLNPKYITLTLSIVSGIITILGINLTGMYANPIVAWALTFNCGDVPHLTHFIVYWMAPLCAFFVSKFLFHEKEEQITEKMKKE